MSGGAGSAFKIKLANRRRLALELRKGGVSYRDIADAIRKELNLEHYGAGLAHRDVMTELDEIKKTCSETAEKVRDMELQRLDELTHLLWEKVQAQDYQAVDRLLRVMDRRAKLLGLDAPTHQVVTGEEGGRPVEHVVIYLPENRRAAHEEDKPTTEAV